MSTCSGRKGSAKGLAAFGKDWPSPGITNSNVNISRRVNMNCGHKLGKGRKVTDENHGKLQRPSATQPRVGVCVSKNADLVKLNLQMFPGQGGTVALECNAVKSKHGKSKEG